MNCLSNTYHEKKTFFVKQWLSDNEYNLYIFAGDDNNIVEEKYKSKNVNKIIIIKDTIYETDSVEAIKYKISSNCFNKSDIENLYMWVKCNLTNDDKKQFAMNLFKNEIKLKTNYINEVTKIFFNKKYFKEATTDRVVIEDFEKVFNASFIYKSLDFQTTDFNDFEVFFSPNPFNNFSEIIENSLRTNKLKSILFKFNIQDSNEINVVKSNEFEFNKIYSSNSLKFKEDVMTIIQEKNGIQKGFSNTDDIVDMITCRIEQLYFRVLPYSHDIQLNMKTIFSVSNTSYTIPIIVYKSKFTNEYKINKIALSDMDKKQLDLFQEQESKYKDSIINRANETIIYFIKIFDNVMFYLLLSSNGSYRLKYKFNKSHQVSMDDIVKSFMKIKDIFNILDNELLYTLNSESDIFNSKMIEIIEYNTQNTLSFKSPIQSKTFLENIKKTNHFFDFVKSDSKSIFQLKFIDTNNFFNTDSVTAFIYTHMELNKTELIDKLQNYFKISNQEANDVYEEKRNKMKLKVTKKGTNVFAVRTYNTAVNVKVNILSDYSIKINTVNTQDNIYQSLILYYLINFLTSKSNVKTKTKKQKEDTFEEVGVNFNDLVDNMGDSEDYDFDSDDNNEFDFDTSSPKLNIETDVSDFDDYEEDEDVKDVEDVEVLEEEDVPESVKKTDYTTFVLDRLYKADSKLFLWKDVSTKLKNYSSKCGAVNYRQPIVISKEEKNNIDKNHPGSYTGYVKTGSTEALKEKNFYICPKIWCRVSKVSITQEEYEKNGNKCPKPHEEEALFFPKKGSKENYFITKDGKESRWPSLLNKNKHPKNLELPCCGKKPFYQQNDDDKKKITNYISNISSELLLNSNQYGNLPNVLNLLLNKKNNCVGIIDSKTHCFVRTGVDNSGNTLFSIIEKILQIDSLQDFIINNMDIEHYILLNGGNTLKIFMNNNEQFKLLEEDEYESFKTYFVENTEYIKKFNLQKEYEYVKNNTKFKLNEDILTKSIIREYLILKSFINFKNYISQNGIEKNLHDVYHLLTHNWLNKENINFIFLEIKNDKIFFINPKYYSYSSKFNSKNKSTIILKINNNYEYISYISQKPKKDISKELLFDSNLIQSLISIVDSFEKKTSGDKLLQEKNIQAYLLSSNLKCIGVIIEDNVVVLGKSQQLHYDDLITTSFVYSDKIEEYEISSKFMKKYDKSFNEKTIETLKSNHSGKLNLDLFVQDLNINNLQEIEEFDYEKELYRVSKEINKKKKLKNALHVLNHSLSNFTDKEKKFLLDKILQQNKVIVDSKIYKERLLHDILHIPLGHLINTHKLKTHKVNREEILLNYNDIVSKKLTTYLNKFKRSQFTIFETSIEDFVEEVEYIRIENNETELPVKTIWSSDRLPIKPVKVAKLFPDLQVVHEDINYDKIIGFFNDIDNTFTLSLFEEKWKELILSSYLKNKTELYDSLNRNINFESQKISKKKYNVNDVIDLINNKDYHYSIYELEIMTKMINLNLLIIGRDTNFIDSGIALINNNSEKYLIFTYLLDKNKYIFRLVVSKDNRHILTKSDFSDDLNKLLKIYTNS